VSNKRNLFKSRPPSSPNKFDCFSCFSPVKSSWKPLEGKEVAQLFGLPTFFPIHFPLPFFLSPPIAKMTTFYPIPLFIMCFLPFGLEDGALPPPPDGPNANSAVQSVGKGKKWKCKGRAERKRGSGEKMDGHKEYVGMWLTVTNKNYLVNSQKI
jgi:hypothetical protein